jgi:hypothetical protein
MKTSSRETRYTETTTVDLNHFGEEVNVRVPVTAENLTAQDVLPAGP